MVSREVADSGPDVVHAGASRCGSMRGLIEAATVLVDIARDDALASARLRESMAAGVVVGDGGTEESERTETTLGNEGWCIFVMEN